MYIQGPDGGCVPLSGRRCIYKDQMGGFVPFPGCRCMYKGQIESPL